MTEQAIAPARPGRLGAWVLASRPRTLPAAAAPVAVGAGCAIHAGGFALGPALTALAGALLLQIAANFANDVFDYERGADGDDRIGPTRAVAAGLVSPRAMKVATAIVLLMATACGAYLTAVAGPAVVVIGVLSIGSALAYTGGPWPLGYHGLGDLFVYVFFGFVAVCGTAFVEMGRVPVTAWIGAAGVGALVTALLAVNNLRDRETDLACGKRTLAVRLGRGGALAEHLVLHLVALAAPIAIFALGLAGPLVLLPVVALPLFVHAVRGARRASDAAAWQRCLAGAGRLLVVYGALFACGLALAGP